jgi:hypothetical protein
VHRPGRPADETGEGTLDVEEWAAKYDGNAKRLIGERTRPAEDATIVRRRKGEVLGGTSRTGRPAAPCGGAEACGADVAPGGMQVLPALPGPRETSVPGRRNDQRPPLERGLAAAAGLTAGTWASVEALSLLAIEAKGRPEATTLHQSALDAAAGLSDGTWDSVRALACLARAERELSDGHHTD